MSRTARGKWSGMGDYQGLFLSIISAGVLLALVRRKSLVPLLKATFRVLRKADFVLSSLEATKKENQKCDKQKMKLLIVRPI